MSWALELQVIRRFLRDPDGNIWSNDLLRDLYNQAQNELQHKSKILENVTGIQIPPEFNSSYQHDWEYSYRSNNRYRCLRNQGGNYTFCYRWEVQEYYGASADIGDEGYGYTHPWESFVGITPNQPPAFPFPNNMNSVKAMYLDEEPLGYVAKKTVSSVDSSWVTRTGETQGYYPLDGSSNHFGLYVRPSTITWSDDEGSGMAVSGDGDTVEDEGTIIQREGSISFSEAGISVDIIESENNIILVFDVSPTEIETVGDDSDFPEFLNKYIRYRVLSLAFGANTDGRIESLAQFWGQRASIGMEAVKRFRDGRNADRDRRLRAQGVPVGRGRRHPRLPDAYPAI